MQKSNYTKMENTGQVSLYEVHKVRQDITSQMISKVGCLVWNNSDTLTLHFCQWRDSYIKTKHILKSLV